MYAILTPSPASSNTCDLQHKDILHSQRPAHTTQEPCVYEAAEFLPITEL
eukprot:c38706_g1_i1 orf=50-199(-)